MMSNNRDKIFHDLLSGLTPVVPILKKIRQTEPLSSVELKLLLEIKARLNESAELIENLTQEINQQD
jgi:hypothetical protein